jgi:hypothetical protein
MEKVKSGDRIKIVNMEGEPSYKGREGIVAHIDDVGQIHRTWDGGTLIPKIDIYIIIERQRVNQQS